MEKQTLINEKLMENGQTKIYMGIAIIILMTIFMGTLLTQRILKSVKVVTQTANEILSRWHP